MINTYLYSNLHSASPLFEPSEAWLIISPETFSVLFLVAFFFTLAGAEFKTPYNNWPLKKWAESCHTNLNLFLFNNIALSLLSVSSLLLFAEQYSGFGLLSHMTSFGWKIILSFLLLDLVTYLWHLTCHKCDWLWMFHKVHHSDPYLNVSTAFRLHIIELSLFTLIKVISLIVFGIDKTTALICEVITTLFVMFHHTNIKFSAENKLGLLVIVPSLHRLHHSVERVEHDQNYGAVLSIWDLLFDTFRYSEPSELGIKAKCGLSFFEQLKFGFTTKTCIKTPALFPTVSTHAMIETAAYFKALNRDFSPGREIDDWLEAEAEIHEEIRI